MCFPSQGYKASNFVKKLDVTDVYKTSKFEGFDRESCPGPFKTMFPRSDFFIERILMDSSYILWNKFQDYQLKFILKKKHFLVTT